MEASKKRHFIDAVVYGGGVKCSEITDIVNVSILNLNYNFTALPAVALV